MCIGDSDIKDSASNAGDPGSIPGSGRSPGEENGNPLQYSFMENSRDRGAQWLVGKDSELQSLHAGRCFLGMASWSLNQSIAICSWTQLQWAPISFPSSLYRNAYPSRLALYCSACSSDPSRKFASNCACFKSLSYRKHLWRFPFVSPNSDKGISQMA